MKKTLLVFILMLVFAFLFSLSVSAKENSELENKIDSLYDSLSDEVKEDLSSISADSANLETLNDISFNSVMNLIFEKVAQESTGPFSSCAVVIAIMILNSLLSSYIDSLIYSSMSEILKAVTTLCVITSVTTPVIHLISDCLGTVKDASNFMLLYIPVMVSILAFSGHAVSGASYYSFMVLACQGVSRMSTDVISPLLNSYLAFCISSSLTQKVNLKGLCNMMSKVIKWLISFTMTVFSALMTIKGIIATAYDSVTARAVRFTMSSFIPIVGAALAESYKTIQGSINLLRTGAGVFVILAICIVFLPVIVRCVLWLFTLNLCKSIGEMICVDSQMDILKSVSSVISTVFAITVCVMSVFVISTALLITLGGGTA